MRPGAKSNLTHRLRDLAAEVAAAADRLEKSEEGPPFQISVGWGANGVSIMVDDRATPHDAIEGMVDAGIWALFESTRRSDDPGDSEAFERVMARAMAEARRRCHQQ